MERELVDEKRFPIRVYIMVGDNGPLLDTWFKEGPLVDYGGRMTVRDVVPSRSKPDRGYIRSAYEVFNQHGDKVMTMIGLGIFWASAVGVPYLMVASMVPARRTGVYMGILNMMIVVPMLVETVTFGWIFDHLLHNKGSNAIMLAGALMAAATEGGGCVTLPAGCGAGCQLVAELPGGAGAG